MASFARHLVSKKKRRFQQDGYDLDMVFITDQLVAMGFPAQGREAFYRNPLSVVKRFFDERHMDRYRIYNLCVEPERQYDPALFYGRVASYPFADHQAPPFTLLEAFSEDAHRWLGENKDNIVVTHCKAGKGRTGVMICAYLLYSKACATADEALNFYGEKRTSNGKGVTIPSQRRYIHYFAKYLATKEEKPYEIVSQSMSSVVLKNPPKVAAFRVIIKQNSPHPEQLLETPWVEYAGAADSLSIEFSPVVVTGDVFIQLEYREGRKTMKMCHFWFNTFFEQATLTLTQPEIDKAHKDRKNKFFPEGFSIEVPFRRGSSL